MLKLLVYLMFFPIIIAFKMMGWIVKGILTLLSAYFGSKIME